MRWTRKLFTRWRRRWAFLPIDCDTCRQRVWLEPYRLRKYSWGWDVQLERMCVLCWNVAVPQWDKTEEALDEISPKGGGRRQ